MQENETSGSQILKETLNFEENLSEGETKILSKSKPLVPWLKEMKAIFVNVCNSSKICSHQCDSNEQNGFEHDLHKWKRINF